MGAELVVTMTNAGLVTLNGFADTEIVKLTLRSGNWAIFGRVVLYNSDNDYQSITAKILHDQNVPIDVVTIWSSARWRGCVEVQATLSVKEAESITLECNTYSGRAEFGSLFALRVDDIEAQ